LSPNAPHSAKNYL